MSNNIEWQVCTLAQAKRLKELGVAQVSVCCFIGEELHLFEKSFYDWAEQKNMNAVAAYTVAELGIALPGFYSYYNVENKKWTCFDTLNNKLTGFYPTEAQAKSALLIYRLENKLTTADEVNACLNNQLITKQ